MRTNQGDDNTSPNPPAQPPNPQLPGAGPQPPPPDIPGITPTPALLGPYLPSHNLTGLARLDSELGERALKVGTPEADQFVLGLQLAPDDWDYSNNLQHMQTEARKRQDLRGQYPNATPDEEAAIQAGHVPNPRSPDGLEPNERAALADTSAVVAKQRDVANKRAANEDATRGKPHGVIPVIVDSHGNPTNGHPQAPGQPASQSAAQSGGGPSTSDTGKLVLNGGYVWLGAGPDMQETAQFAKDAKGNYVQDKDGNFVKTAPQGNTAHGQDVYMKTDDAKASLYGLSEDQVKHIQAAYHLPQTGIVDNKTLAVWAEAVDAAAGYTKAGKRMSPIDVLGMQAIGSKGSGGGGGGAGAAKFKLSDVQALLTSVTQKELGRDPTQAEVNSFFSYFGGLAGGDTASPSQIATDWVRTHNGSEHGSYGAATNYYQAMLSVLGPSAAGGAG